MRSLNRSLDRHDWLIAKGILLALLGTILACSGKTLVDLPVTTGGRRTLPAAPGSVEVPPGLRIVDPQTWALPLPDGKVIGLRLQRLPDPDGGAMAQVDKLIRQMEKTGQAGVERDAVVQLGDLEGRLVQAVDLGKEDPQALWLVVAVAEDGVYTASVAGPATEVRSRRGMLEGFLLSLRVPVPGRVPAPAPADPLALDVTPGSLP